MKRPKRGEIYEHFKGGVYQVMGYARHHETLEDWIIYKSFKDEITWMRPLDEFMDIHLVHKVKRFEKVEIE